MSNKSTKRDVIIFLIISFLVISAILVKPINDLDELWNYNFARNIADGKLPYKDFNMIQMPLLAIICGFALKIFGNQLIVMRLIAVVLNSLILLMIYKIFNRLKINNYLTYLSLILIYFLYYNYFCLDYNFSILLITLSVIYLEIKHIENDDEILKTSVKYDFTLGILVGTSILLKQTTGIFLSLIFIFYKALIVSNKEEWKNSGKIIFRRMVGVSIPIILLFFYLSVNNIWDDFLDYAIYGIKTFTNNIPYIKLLCSNKIFIRVLSILVPITIMYMYFKSIVKKQTTKEDKNIFILFAYSVASFIVAFPISDSVHFLIGSMTTIISLVYILWLKINRIKNYKMRIYIKQYCKAFCQLIMITILILAAILIILNFINYQRFSKLRHFKFIQSNMDNDIKIIDNYITDQNLKGKKVYILDATACMYMIPLDKYNKAYDMFLIGNIGLEGEEGQIQKLDKEENIIVLILNDNYTRNWQNPELVRKHIKNNWKNIGTIEKFDIYEKE